VRPQSKTWRDFIGTVSVLAPNIPRALSLSLYQKAEQKYLRAFVFKFTIYYQTWCLTNKKYLKSSLRGGMKYYHFSNIMIVCPGDLEGEN
jgi:hypothetical protein